jgi:hypothetical protein
MILERLVFRSSAVFMSGAVAHGGKRSMGMENSVVEVRTLSTDAFPERLRLDAWRDFMGRCVGEFDAMPAENHPIRAGATYFALADLGVM